MKKIIKRTAKDIRFWVVLLSIWGIVLAGSWYYLGVCFHNKHTHKGVTIETEYPWRDPLVIAPASGPPDDSGH